MNRTTIMLPESLKAKAARIAAKRGMSLGELIREGLNQVCAKKDKEERSAFFEDKQVYSGKIPSDISSQHDNYLY